MDEQFLKDTRGTGFVGDLARAAIRAKRALGLDDYFRGDIDDEQYSAFDSIDSLRGVQNMEGGDSGGQNSSEGEEGNGCAAIVISRLLPGPSSTSSRTTAFMKYDGITTSSRTEPINSIGLHLSPHYIVPYFLNTWVTLPKWKATIRNATL